MIHRDEILEMARELDDGLDEHEPENQRDDRLQALVPQACEMLRALAAERVTTTTPWADQLAVRDQMITDLMEALSRVVRGQEQGQELEEVLAEARHTLDNVRDARPKDPS